MPRYEIIAGLDIGATKICLAVAKKQFNSPCLEFLGCYKAVCSGMRNGAVTDLSLVADSVSSVLEQAQESTGQKISTAFVSISGAHIVSENARGRVNLLDKENEISKKDLDSACRNATGAVITYDREPLMIVPQNYYVDSQGPLKNPSGLFGSRLEANYLFITALTPAVENLCRAINNGGLEVEELVLSNQASGFSALNESEKDMGVILIDIGNSITEATIFTEGVIRFDKMLSCGAENLSDAIAAELKIQPEAARKAVKNYCKLSLSGAYNPDEMVLIKEAAPAKSITQAGLEKIIEPKIKNILNTVKDALNNSNYAQMASCGAVLIGGISTMDGLAEMAETVFNMPVRMGLAIGTPDIKESSCITAAGLVKYGSTKRAGHGFGRRLSENILKKTYQRAMDFVNDYF